VVIICTTRFYIKKFSVLPTQCIYVYFMWISEQTEFIGMYSINWLVFITKTECIYCLVQSEILCVREVVLVLHSYRAEANIRSHICPCEICGGQSGAGKYFSPSTSVFPCLYHSTSAPYWPSYSHYIYQKGKRSKLGNTHEAMFLWRSRGT